MDELIAIATRFRHAIEETNRSGTGGCGNR